MLPYFCLFVLMLFPFCFVAGAHADESAGGAQQGGNVVTLHKSDNGRQVDVKPGDVVQVELSGSGGTGYWWHVTKLDTACAELVSEETKPAADPKLLGGPVQGIWRFKAKTAGKTDLVMKYYRVWEGPDKSEDQFSVVFNIR